MFSQCNFCLSSQRLFSACETYLLDILHPLSHLLVAHVIDILDEGIVLLPEGHPEAATLRGCDNRGSTLVLSFSIFHLGG